MEEWRGIDGYEGLYQILGVLDPAPLCCKISVLKGRKAIKWCRKSAIYIICKADMLIKGHNANNIIFGDSLTQDGLPDKKFRYMLTNPPFGVDWKKREPFINRGMSSESPNR